MNKKYPKYILCQKIIIFLFIQFFLVKSFLVNDTDSNIIINKNLRKNSNEDLNIPNKVNSIIIGPEDEDSNFISSYVNKDGQLFVETFSNKISNKRYIYSLLNNGREFYENSINEITLEKKLLNIKNMNSISLKSKYGKTLLNIFYGDNNSYYFEYLNISSYANKIYYKPKEDLKNLKILSIHCSDYQILNYFFPILLEKMIHIT